MGSRPPTTVKAQGGELSVRTRNEAGAAAELGFGPHRFSLPPGDLSLWEECFLPVTVGLPSLSSIFPRLSITITLEE